MADGLTYEFSSQENETVRVLSSRMRFVGIMNLIGAGFYAIAGIFAMLVKPLLSILYAPPFAYFLFVGMWTITAGSEFRSIVDTSGQDIPHLMTALGSLRKLYNLQFWLIIIVIIMFVLGIGLTLIMGAAGTVLNLSRH